MCRSRMLFVFGGAEPSGRRRSFAHVRTGFRIAVVLVTGEVIDLRIQIDPHDCISRAARFGFGLGCVLPRSRRRTCSRRPCCCRWWSGRRSRCGRCRSRPCGRRCRGSCSRPCGCRCRCTSGRRLCGRSTGAATCDIGLLRDAGLLIGGPVRAPLLLAPHGFLRRIRCFCCRFGRRSSRFGRRFGCRLRPFRRLGDRERYVAGLRSRQQVRFHPALRR